jgi:hypothetical protein
MEKSTFKILCDHFNINPRGMKVVLKKNGLSRKDIDPKRLVELVYLDAPDLLWSRSCGDNEVEYYDSEHVKQVINDMKIINKGTGSL